MGSALRIGVPIVLAAIGEAGSSAGIGVRRIRACALRALSIIIIAPVSRAVIGASRVIGPVKCAAKRAPNQAKRSADDVAICEPPSVIGTDALIIGRNFGGRNFAVIGRSAIIVARIIIIGFYGRRAASSHCEKAGARRGISLHPRSEPEQRCRSEQKSLAQHAFAPLKRIEERIGTLNAPRSKQTIFI
jgi:hypothetical protein